jgi:predicted DNA-binding antitoxin AbrB/MazE fold protein
MSTDWNEPREPLGRPDAIFAEDRYNLRNGMSIKVSYRDGVFEPLEKVGSATPGKIYTVFSDEELRDIRETFGWLKAAEKSFDFWNNPADAVYDTL